MLRLGWKSVGPNIVVDHGIHGGLDVGNDFVERRLTQPLGKGPDYGVAAESCVLVFCLGDDHKARIGTAQILEFLQ